MKCVRPNCPNKAPAQKNRGMCHKHYQAAPKGFVPAGPVLEHYAALRSAGLSVFRIADLAGVHVGTLHMLGEWSANAGVRLETAQRVLSVPVPRRVIDGGGLVGAIGTRRRLQALMAIGWPLRVIAEEIGMSVDSLQYVSSKAARVTSRTAAAVATVFDRLQFTPGPSEVPKRWAKSKGWALPLQWDEYAIDDPAETPDCGGSRRVPFVERYAELSYLSIPRSEMPARLGIQRESLDRQLQRHKEAV